MNYTEYSQPNGFPLDTNVLNIAQVAYTIFNQLGWLGGDLTIITGCYTTRTNVSDGYVFINGEVLPFTGGSIGTNVIIQQTVTNAVYENGVSKPTFYERFATFGTAAPEDTYLWSDFKRVFQTKDIQTFKDNFESRITALENKQSDVPSGTIVRYDHPLVIPPPPGWEDYNPSDEQGRVWAARSTSDSDFGLGVKGGAKTHTLSINETPEHFHLQGSESLYNFYGGGNPVGPRNYASHPSQISYSQQRTSSVGENQAHNNLQPYIAVRYIIKL